MLNRYNDVCAVHNVEYFMPLYKTDNDWEIVMLNTRYPY